MTILDVTKLEGAYKAVLDRKAKAETEIKKVIESYVLKAVLLASKSRHIEAVECYEAIFKIHKENPDLKQSYPKGLALLYILAASDYNKSGNYKKALELKQKGWAIWEESASSTNLVSHYYNIAIKYYSKGNYEKALEYQQKAITIQEEKLDTKSPSLAKSYNAIARTYK